MKTSYGYPFVSSVQQAKDRQLLLTFENGEKRLFDASKMLAGMEGKWLGELLNDSYFKQATVVKGIVTWPNGQDICPDCIYEDSVLVN